MRYHPYTVKNILWCCIVALYILVALLTSGCSGIKVTGYTVDPLYYRDCLQPNSKFTQADKECRHHLEPKPEFYAVQEMDTKSTWRDRPDILEWCRRIENPKRERRCQGMPGL